MTIEARRSMCCLLMVFGLGVAQLACAAAQVDQPAGNSKLGSEAGVIYGESQPVCQEYLRVLRQCPAPCVASTSVPVQFRAVRGLPPAAARCPDIGPP